MKYFTFALMMLAMASAANWAVLVCGSHFYWNYRHHADVSHAYQIMKKGGIDADHIITMMYNDVPNDSDNPLPGALYNHPGSNPTNVYEGVIVDYEKYAVSDENLIKVLTGDESAGGKVLKSTKDDNVFLFFSDHGGEDILALPGGYLHSKDLLNAIKTMHEKEMYNKFVLYIEACYSGSMFLNLPEDLNVVAVTAANDNESSYGWYCGDEAVVKGQNMDTCLGDEFSVRWMEDADKGNQKTETLEDQFNYLVKAVTKSHVMRYGDKSFASDVIGEFIGYPSERSSSYNAEETSEAWDSRDIKLLYLQSKAKHTTGAEHAKWYAAYLEEVKERAAIDRYFNALTQDAKYYKAPGGVKNVDCYKTAIAQYTAIMGRSDYALKYYNVLANMCNENPLAFSGY
jgi:legumain